MWSYLANSIQSATLVPLCHVTTYPQVLRIRIWTLRGHYSINTNSKCLVDLHVLLILCLQDGPSFFQFLHSLSWIIWMLQSSANGYLYLQPLPLQSVSQVTAKMEQIDAFIVPSISSPPPTSDFSAASLRKGVQWPQRQPSTNRGPQSTDKSPAPCPLEGRF